MAEDQATFFARWSQEMASNTGSKVPGPEQAIVPSGTGVGGPKAGYTPAPKSKTRGRIPPVSAAFARKVGGIR